jgi:hypothetical protein
MGLLDRFRRGPDLEVDAPPPVVLDQTLRTKQLLVLASALDDLVAGMREDASQRYNPGWSARVDEYVAAGESARRLRQDGFDLEALHDLAAEIRPLFVRGKGIAPTPEMVALEPQQDAVMAAVEDLRRVLPQERAGGS